MIKKKSIRGVSEMVSYIILFSIVLGISAGVYTWLKYFPPIIEEEKDCPSGTSIVLENCHYDLSTKTLKLDLWNNGKFNIDGIILKVSNDSGSSPITMLKPSEGVAAISGHYQFLPLLKPGDSNVAIFQSLFYDEKTNSYNNYDITKIGRLNIQPYIVKDKKIICTKSILNEKANCLDSDCQNMGTCRARFIISLKKADDQTDIILGADGYYHIPLNMKFTIIVKAEDYKPSIKKPGIGASYTTLKYTEDIINFDNNIDQFYLNYYLTQDQSPTVISENNKAVYNAGGLINNYNFYASFNDPIYKINATANQVGETIIKTSPCIGNCDILDVYNDVLMIPEAINEYDISFGEIKLKVE